MQTQELLDRLNADAKIKVRLVHYRPKDSPTSPWSQSVLLTSENKFWRLINRLMNAGHEYHVEEFFSQRKFYPNDIR